MWMQVEKIEESELKAYLLFNKVEVEEFADRYGAEGFGRSLYITDPDGNVVELKFSLTWIKWTIVPVGFQ